LHNPLGLSQRLKSSSTAPQVKAKIAAIVLPIEAKSGSMVQTLPRRKCYVFYKNIDVRYWKF
jgi:hypothetical protein